METTAIAHLSGPGGAFIEFGIIGYEFPDMTPRNDWHDRNWLRVQFRVCNGKRTWSRNEPAWQTDDVARLAEWLRLVARGRSPLGGWEALEPLLTLSCERAEAPVMLRAEIDLELRSHRAKIAGFDSETLLLTPEPGELLQAATAMDQALKRFPRR